jgi:hypothetical protein
MNRIRLLTCCVVFACLSGCGYQFQGRHNPLQDLGVEKIYVSEFRNNSFRPGVEQLFSTAMIREIQKSGSFRLVESRDEADAILSGNVLGVGSDISSSKSIDINATGGKTVDVATEYNATVQCEVTLTDRRGRVIFSQATNSNKIYPGATNTGEQGAVNSTVNDSEQRLAIQFIASQMMAGVYQRMIDTF